MAFTKEQKAEWRKLPHVVARQKIHNEKSHLKEQTSFILTMFFEYPWFVKWWVGWQKYELLRKAAETREKEGKSRVAKEKRAKAEESKPIEIRGILPKDMTKEQRAIWQQWSHRNVRYRSQLTPKQLQQRRRTNKEYRKKMSLEAKEKELQSGRVYKRRLRAEDVEYQLLHSLRNRLLGIVRSARCQRPKEGLTQAARDFVGCTLIELKTHLEAQFIGCMSWKNYGKAWHIDHRVPCAYFDLSTERGRRHCFHFTNLRPLWAKTNLRRLKNGESVQQELPFGQSVFAVNGTVP
jgi:hypothetical protein